LTMCLLFVCLPNCATGGGKSSKSCAAR